MPDTNRTLPLIDHTEVVSAPKDTTMPSDRIGGPAPDRTQAILAYIVTAGFFGLLVLLLFLRPPDSNLAMLNIVLGSLGTAWLGAMAYFFGGSAKPSSGRQLDLAYGSPDRRGDGSGSPSNTFTPSGRDPTEARSR